MPPCISKDREFLVAAAGIAPDADEFDGYRAAHTATMASQHGASALSPHCLLLYTMYLAAGVCREMTALIRVVYSHEVQQDLPGV